MHGQFVSWTRARKCFSCLFHMILRRNSLRIKNEIKLDDCTPGIGGQHPKMRQHSVTSGCYSAIGIRPVGLRFADPSLVIQQKMVEPRGVEPLTFSLRTRRSTN